MKLAIAVFALVFSFGSIVSSSASDERELIELTPEIQTRLLAEMRQITYDLDELVAAIAEGDFLEARKIAILKMGFGHNRSVAMLKSGKSEEEVLAVMEPFLAKRLKMFEEGNMQHRQGGKGGGSFAGLGQHLPEKVRSLGQAMHASAVKLAFSAKKAGKNPTAQDFKEVLTHLQGMTATCAGCHQAFKIR